MTRKKYITRIRYHEKDDEFARTVGIDLRGALEAEPYDEVELSEEVPDLAEAQGVGLCSVEEKNLEDADLWSGLHKAA